jgi:PTH1 family peptidyl-tRNA hydrolase
MDSSDGLAQIAMDGSISTLIIGLGNPGDQYARTRHNVGFMTVDFLARETGVERWSTECRSRVCRSTIAGKRVVLAKPLTYMNLSGLALQMLIAEHRLELKDVVLIVDDFNLPFGKIRLRAGGSAGGHHGLESVIRALATEEFLRIRLGIGEEIAPADKAEFVLSEFPPGRKSELSDMIIRAGEAVKLLLSDGAARAMCVFNA